MAVQHSTRLVAHVHGGTIEDELTNAIEYGEGILQRVEWMTPIGKAAATSTPKQVVAKLGTTAQYSPDAVKFGGTLGMLNVRDRVAPISDMDVARMRYGCEVLDETHRFSKVLEDIAVHGEIESKDEWAAGDLRRVERDAEIDVVLMSIYWHMPSDASQTHPLKDLARDLEFSAQRVGHGLELDIERFKRKMDEEKKRAAIGQSAWRTALECRSMVAAAEEQRDGRSDADLLAAVLATRPELAKDWKTDTCSRCLMVATMITDKAKKILSRWELAFQRNALLDGITLFRAAATAAAKPEEFELLVETLFFEQVCQLRRTIAPKGRGHLSDCTNVMRGVLLRQALYAYLKQILPKLADNIKEHGTWEWFKKQYGMTETGQLPHVLPNDSDEDPDTPSKGLCPSSEAVGASRFASKVKLLNLCEQVAKGKHDWGFAQLGKAQGHASSLDFSAESMRNLKAKIQEIWTDYCAEFPPETVPQEVPGATAASTAQPATEIRASSRIESEQDYHIRLAEWGQQCEKAVEDATEDYIFLP